MHFLKVPKKDGESVRLELIRQGILAHGYRIITDADFIFFPISADSWEGYSTVEMEGEKLAEKSHDLREVLSGKLSDSEMDMLITSYDIVGDIIIAEIPDALLDKEKTIADALLQVNPNAKTVVKKLGPMEGEFRVRKVKVIAGENGTETTHKEHGCRIKLDLGTVYFSVRLSTERKRIAKEVKPGERIIALFAGVGPFPLVISRYQPDCEIAAIELNPDAVAYLEENIRINKAEGTITSVLGDAEKIVMDRYQDYADRVIMPLPKTADEFLDVAIAGIRNTGIIHFYTFDSEGTAFPGAERKMRKAAKDAGVDFEIINRRVVRPYAPGVVQVVLDVMIKKETSKRN
jgi:tRNA (guanine37-N1)-methyltransferase